MIGDKIAQVFDNPWLMGDGPRARQRLGARYAVLTLNMLLAFNGPVCLESSHDSLANFPRNTEVVS